MIGYFWLGIALATLGFLAYRAGSIWMDSRQWVLSPSLRLGWALVGAIAPARYWWGARIEAMSRQEQADLLALETEGLGLSRADSLRCPLCGGEVPQAWTLTGDGQLTVAAGPIECVRCDFRLDACRHCAHFLPGLPQSPSALRWGGPPDMTSGRCNVHKTLQPVEQACPPDMACRLRAQGYEQLRAPMHIADSFLPPDSCRAFRPSRTRLRDGKVHWPDARRQALLRLLTEFLVPDSTPRQDLVSEDEKWLL